MLRTEFACTEEEVNIIAHLLVGMMPTEDVEYVNQVEQGLILPPKSHPLIIEMEDGTTQVISLTNHPLMTIHPYLVQKYRYQFGVLYWLALTSVHQSSAYYQTLCFYRKRKDLTMAREE